MSQRPGSKSLAEQQQAFKKGLLNQSKVISSIAEARSNNIIKNHAYGNNNLSLLSLLKIIDRSFASNCHRRKNTHKH